MAQKDNQNNSLTVMDYLDNQTAALEALIPTGIKGKRNTTLIYVAALLVAFGISYGIGRVMHSATVKANADPDKTISVSDANSLTYENAYQYYQQSNLGNDIGISKNGGYVLSLNGYTIVPNTDGTALNVNTGDHTYEIVAADVSGLNLIGDTLYYVTANTIHSCNAADGSNDTIVPISADISQLIAADNFLFYIDAANGNNLMRCTLDGADITTISYRSIQSFVIVGGDAICLTSDGELYRFVNSAASASSSGILLANSISDFQYNGDIIALNAGNLISFETDKSDYKELVMDQSVSALVSSTYQHIYYVESGTLYDLNSDTLDAEKVSDISGVSISIDSIGDRLFATRKVRNGDYYTYSNGYLN